MVNTFRLESYLSEPLRNLLRSMLEVSVEKRIKLHGVAEHPWVTEDGLSPMMVDVCCFEFPNSRLHEAFPFLA